jgi:hypothetical protein
MLQEAMMFLSLSVHDMFLTMGVILFGLGVLAIIIGVFILVSRIFGSDLKVIADQTTHLAQKGIAEEVAGLVGNATSLVTALNELVKTSSGIGMFLIITGMLLAFMSYFVILKA